MRRVAERRVAESRRDDGVSQKKRLPEKKSRRRRRRASRSPRRARPSSLSPPSERPRSNARRDGRVHERPSLIRISVTSTSADDSTARASTFASARRFDLLVRRREPRVFATLRLGRRVDHHQAQHDALVDLHDGRRRWRRRVRDGDDDSHGGSSATRSSRPAVSVAASAVVTSSASRTSSSLDGSSSVAFGRWFVVGAVGAVGVGSR